MSDAGASASASASANANVTVPTGGKVEVPQWAQQCLKLVQYTSQDLPILGSDKPISTMRHSINITKGVTIFVSILLMLVFGNTSNTGAWVYIALHGSYSILWVSKDYCFPDPRWGAPQTKGGFAFVVIVLMGYWLAPYQLNATHFEASNLRICVCVFLYILGVCLMFGSDCQKYYQLKFRRGLITDGFFAYTRNPNYLGEMMLYGAFALLSGSIVAIVYLAMIWGSVFVPNMLRKDASISRYPEWEQYSKQSGMLIPNFAAFAADLKAIAAAHAAAGKSA